jgi:hypothetical protein
MIPEIAHEHFLKVPVCRRKDFEILFEEHIKGTFVHCNVTTYNASVKRELLECWDIVSYLHGGPIYALHDFSDRKHEKFLKMFGFSYFKTLPNLQQIWIWRNNNGQFF